MEVELISDLTLVVDLVQDTDLYSDEDLVPRWIWNRNPRIAKNQTADLEVTYEIGGNLASGKWQLFIES